MAFCKRCVTNNHRPCSRPEHMILPHEKPKSIFFDENGVCDGCRAADVKAKIDWKVREKALLELLDKHRGRKPYDCLVPGSGGKDSSFATHILKSKYGMNPLTCTWPPLMYTDVGKANYDNWLKTCDVKNIVGEYAPSVHALLTKLAIQNLFHPFHTFILGQKNLAPRVAARYNIPLVFYGENEAEYGNPLADNSKSLRDKSLFTISNMSSIRFSGLTPLELKQQHGLSFPHLRPYYPPEPSLLEQANIEVHYLGYYLRWDPQEVYMYAQENCGFQTNDRRTEQTYSKYNSLDDKIDGLHYYTTRLKFGIGRCSYDASQEIRNGRISRAEGVARVKKYDHEFPRRYFKEVIEYINMKPQEFFDLCNSNYNKDLFLPPVMSGGFPRFDLKKPIWDKE